MEYVFEFVIEILFDLYDEIVSYFLPSRLIPKWLKIILRLICAIISITNVGLVFAGVWYINENVMPLGLILTAIGGALIIVHVILVIILHKKRAGN